jgi:hypothetical protein
MAMERNDGGFTRAEQELLRQYYVEVKPLRDQHQQIPNFVDWLRERRRS